MKKIDNYKTKVTAVIGEAGSGKTTITKFLCEHLNSLHIEVDKVGHQVLEDPEVITKLLMTFGESILTTEGAVNRKALGTIVFSDDSGLERLNAITHPMIYQKVKTLIADNMGRYDYIFVEGAVLITIGIDQLCDEVVYFYADKEERVRRLVEGRGINKEKALAIVEAQKNLIEDKDMITTTIDTTSGDDEMFKEILNGFRKALDL